MNGKSAREIVMDLRVHITRDGVCLVSDLPRGKFARKVPWSKVDLDDGIYGATVALVERVEKLTTVTLPV